MDYVQFESIGCILVRLIILVRLVDVERRVRGLEEEKAELELKLSTQQDYTQVR